MAASSIRSLARSSAGTSTVRRQGSWASPVPAASRTSSCSSPFATMRVAASTRRLRSNRASRATRRISRASRRHGPAVIIRTSAASSWGSAMARRPCSRSRISGASNRLSPPTTVYGMSSSRSRATMASRCLCLRYRTATSFQRRPLPSPASARMASTMATASSSVPAHRCSSTGTPASFVGPQALVGLEAGDVALDEPVGGVDDVAARAEVLVDAEAPRAAEPGVELRERGVVRATEAVDGLVVVPHHHHVGGAVRGLAQELDELDLGDVGVLELVHQDVAELALPSSEDVGAGLEQPGHEGDLLAEVEGAAGGQLGLVGAVDDGHLGEAQDLEGGAVALVLVGQGVDAGVVLVGEVVAAVGVAVTGDGAAGLAVRGLHEGAGVVLAQLAGVLGALVGAEAGVGAADRAQRREVALGLEAQVRLVEVPVAGLVDPALLRDEAVEVVRVHQLVLGPVDELDEARERVVGVVAAGRGWAAGPAGGASGRRRRARPGARAGRRPRWTR